VRLRHLTVYAAIAANAAIAITKFVVAIATQSGALFSEGIHSVVDTGDGLLLLLGIHLSHRPPSERHPWGRGLEIYFWSMVVAMVIFGIGGGVSIYQGINHLIEPHLPMATFWTYLVLGIAFTFESVSWTIAIRNFRRADGNRRSLWQGIRTSKDPTTFTIILEDSAALIGIVFAAVGITLAHAFDLPAFDAVASILIGLLLCVVAGILGRETWSLVIGESADPAIVDDIRRIVGDHGSVADAKTPLTMHFGPDTIYVSIDVRLADAGSVHDAAVTMREIEESVRSEYPLVKRVSVRLTE
jgi:cation diffusion facilitator family transporter